MDPWFAAEKPVSGVTLHARTPSGTSNYHNGDFETEVEETGDDAEKRLSQSGELLTDLYSGNNLELQDYAQYTGNYRFTQYSAVAAGSDGFGVSHPAQHHGGNEDYPSGGFGAEGGDFSAHWSPLGGRHHPHQDGSSSIVGLADSEGNGFDSFSFRDDGSSQYGRSGGDAHSVRSQEVYPAWNSQDSQSEVVEARGQLSAGEISVQERNLQDLSESGGKTDAVGVNESGGGGGVVMATRKKVQAKEALRGISEAERQMEQALRSNMSNRLSSVVPANAVMLDSLERICTVEELWLCASVSLRLSLFLAHSLSIQFVSFSIGLVRRIRRSRPWKGDSLTSISLTLTGQEGFFF